ncbi:alkene reductase [Ancylobacter sp. FA202]|uniref:alkene reductase n=1 Tax=Ancylobacter sp. FA202 TaxID=1111106 RepID=UPI000363B6AF|nr:alkene reductase [Ancylobacter sp. FA202]
MAVTKSLFDTYRLGDIILANRIVMAPLTRNRAGAGLVPSPLAVEYYRQRATAGLIITEATQISATAQGYQDTPGLFTQAQIEGWKKITDAVHSAGGHIFVQLWHVGRVSLRSLQPDGAAPLAPSALRANTKTYANNGFAEVDEPRALTLDEIPGIVEDFRQAAANAILAGFDGVEIHGANGYLIDQFLRDGANKRTDAYGGSIENRTRFLKEVLAAVIGEIGAARTGLRLSPVTPANDLADSDPQALFSHVMDVVESLHPVYVHMIEGATGGPRDIVPDFDFAALRARYSGAWMVNNGYDKAMAEEVVATGKADLVAFGKAFISSPDAVERLRRGVAFNELDRDHLYGGGAKGYTDYPTLENAGA